MGVQILIVFIKKKKFSMLDSMYKLNESNGTLYIFRWENACGSKCV